ncbi:MAG: porin [Hydrogenophaga sp.]|uniref:porin n=1 Tax=Hydrogenophaga sp. TaxID=1904254 RepID=UPI004036CA94
MKKSLMALAVLACTGSAMAQTNVTLYGRIDASLGATKLNGVSTTQLYSGNLTNSRWGMRGSEDLGGGLKALFQLETAFNADDGTGAAGFSRQSWVGLSGGFGSVRMGKADSIYKDIFDLGNTYNISADSQFNSAVEAYRAGLAAYVARPNNQIRYDSPSFGGFSAGLTYALDEDVAGTPKVTAIGARYRAGNLDLGVAHQDEDQPLLVNDRQHTTVGATYNFGPARLSAQYQNVKAGDNRKDNEMALGVSVPLGNLELTAGYSRSKAKNAAGATSGKGAAFALAATYAMSKRTRVYGGYLDGETENAAGVTTRDYRLYAVGIRHDF